MTWNVHCLQEELMYAAAESGRVKYLLLFGQTQKKEDVQNARHWMNIEWTGKIRRVHGETRE